MAKGENIFKRKDGRWEARYIKGYELSGKIKYGFCYGKTYREAKEKVTKCKAALVNGKPIPSTNSRHRFSFYCNEWLRMRKPKVKESTYIKYDTALRKHIKPKLGGCFPMGMTTGLIDEFTEELLFEDELAPKTVHDVLVVLHGILKYTATFFTGGFPVFYKIMFTKNIKITSDIFLSLNLCYNIFCVLVKTKLRKTGCYVRQAARTTGFYYMDVSLLPDEGKEYAPKPIRIIVKKAERLLELWRGASLYAQFPVGLGFSPQGQKRMEGDGRTPEGEYYICVRNEKSRFYKSLGLSYPNTEDAKNGFKSGRIDDTIRRLIIQKLSEKGCPPWHTPLGGEIYIHGCGSKNDWTKGCIALENEAMDVLWALCPPGTDVVILP